MRLFPPLGCALALFPLAALAQQKQANYDESAIPPYVLPPLLQSEAGVQITSAAEWITTRRSEVLGLFEKHVFGKAPSNWGKVICETISVNTDALNGKAVRKLVRISLADYPEWQGIELMLHLPKNTAKPVPCFVGASFGGNEAVTSDNDLPLSTRWMRPGKGSGVVDNHSTEKSRGSEQERWQLELAVSEGFAVATYYCGDVEPDHPEGWKTGLRSFLSKEGAAKDWKDGEWGAIGAWAWGLSRIADFLASEPGVDAKKLAVIGHSRLGKTSLWAGAQDTRFGVVISNNSGEGGAALMRRNIGETTAIITKAFPHWFTKTYANYANNEAACPVDSHMLVALAAPRGVYIASAEEDRWADPKGEFLAGLHAQPVFTLFGKKGYGVTELPPVNTPIGEGIRYHIRTGSHDITRYDWEQYIRFARSQFGS
ncbi:MAG: hypothetical protein DVB28_000734 [Verrucomicrobia bacterium]|nr:MAG: hypothetical protein DVB28_000734 [Verrucomicrobiota bacterium]